MREKLLAKIKDFPLKPGVYMFIDKNGVILYVGRATLLKRRVSQYFSKRIDLRIAEMVSLAHDIKYIETDSVLEAIILEANLIKKYWAKYNIKDRDDRSFVYIIVPTDVDYPKPIIVRGKDLQKLGIRMGAFSASWRTETNGRRRAVRMHVFGPYQSLNLVRNALKIIRRIFPYSTCRPLSGKPCFDYQIGLCPGACVGAISKEDYQNNIKDIILLLSGEKKRLLNKLKKENPEKISGIKHIQDVTLISNEEEIGVDNQNRIEGYDISHLSGKETYGSMVVFSNGEPDNANYRLFKIKEAPANDDLKALEETLTRRFSHPEWKFPDIIMIDGGKPQVDHAHKILKKMNINIPMVGISKLRNDALVFPVGTKKSIKDLTQSIYGTLLRVRDEAHRFAKKASVRRRRKMPFNNGGC